MDNAPTPEPTTDAASLRVESHVYTGLRKLSDGKYWHVWRPDGNTDGPITVASRKAMNVVSGASIGHVYDFTMTDKGGYYVAGSNAPRYAQRKAKSELILAWELDDRAARTAQSLEQRAKRDGDESEIDRALAPIAKAMRATNPQGRAAILAYVVTRLNDRFGTL
jgi:hypothetical protein